MLGKATRGRKHLQIVNDITPNNYQNMKSKPGDDDDDDDDDERMNFNVA